MTPAPGHIDPDLLAADIAAYRAEDDAAGDRLYEFIAPPVRREIGRMLGDAAEADDVMQETLLACLGYLRGDREFRGDAVRLAVTIGRNRCRDILRRRRLRPQLDIEPFSHWLADPSRSALDDILADELRAILQDVLDSLARPCRRLLQALYVEDRTPEQARAVTGLDTVQGVYYRRGVCLRQARKLFQNRWLSSSGGDRQRGGRPHGRLDHETDDETEDGER